MPTPSDVCRLQIEESPVFENANTTLTPYRVSTVTRDLALQEFGWELAPSPLDRSDEVRGIEGQYPDLADSFEPGASLRIRVYPNDLVWLLTCCGLTPTLTAGAGGGTSEVQTLTMTGTPTGGTFTLTFAGVGTGASPQTTAPIAYNATAAAVQAALEALPNIGVGNVVGAGGPLPGSAVTITFAGVLGTRNVPQFTASSAGLTGGTTPTMTPTTTTPGAAGSVSDPDGATVPTGAYKWVWAKRGGLTAKTMQILPLYVSSGVYFRLNGMGVSQLGWDAEGNATAELMGLVAVRLASDPSITPVYDAATIPNIRRGDLALSWLANSGTTDQFSIAIRNTLNRRKDPGLGQSYFANKLEQGDDRVLLTGSIPKSSLAAADYDQLKSAATFAATVRWQTPVVIGATTAKYTVWIEMPACQYVAGSVDPLRNARRFGGSFDFKSAWDAAAGYDFRITLLNGVSASPETYV